MYGPLDFFDEIGIWCQHYEMYLQDPETCYIDAKYCNPHRMSSGDVELCPMVSEVVSKPLAFVPKELPEPSDFLDILSSQFDLEETPQPSAIRTNLKRYVAN